MNYEREQELIKNPHLITHAEVRMLSYQNRLHVEMLQLRNQQIRLLKSKMTELIDHMVIGSTALKRVRRWNNALQMSLFLAFLIVLGSLL